MLSQRQTLTNSLPTLLPDCAGWPFYVAAWKQARWRTLTFWRRATPVLRCAAWVLCGRITMGTRILTDVSASVILCETVGSMAQLMGLSLGLRRARMPRRLFALWQPQ
jgi:hypothetical protein